MNTSRMEEEKEMQGTEQFFLQVTGNEDEQMDMENLNCLQEASGSQSQSQTQTPKESMVQDQERRAQVGESPYLAPLTPFDSPGIPKTPVLEATNKSLQIQEIRTRKETSKDAERGSGTVLESSDGVQHLPSDLVDALMATVQTLDKMIVVVEDYKPDQLDFLCEKTNEYIELLQRIDNAAMKYNVEIPIQLLEKLDAEEHFNPEQFTKEQLNACHEESDICSGKIASLQILKDSLVEGFSEL